MGPTGAFRIVQIHPTRRCNLRCLHCYSSSSPEEEGALAVDLLRKAVTDAAHEGYHVISLSGGEPLLYDGIRELFTHVKAVGLGSALTTNGMLLKGRRLERLADVTDLIAVSLDGKPDSHDRIRGSRRAFGAMEANLPALRATGIPFGFIFTLTQHNLDELDWVARFALDQGAKLLQIHPLELAGRARQEMEEEHPDRQETAVAFLEAARLRRQLGDRMKIQVDLSHRQALAAHPERAYADLDRDAANAPLADSVSPLIIESDGAVVPLEYGFSRAFALGNLHDAGLSELACAWKKNGLPAFRSLCRRVHRQATAAPAEGVAAPVFNWYEAVAEASREGEARLARAG